MTKIQICETKVDRDDTASKKSQTSQVAFDQTAVEGETSNTTAQLDSYLRELQNYDILDISTDVSLQTAFRIHNCYLDEDWVRRKIKQTYPKS